MDEQEQLAQIQEWGRRFMESEGTRTRTVQELWDEFTDHLIDEKY